jgi:anti-anti-sigma regulatory factor
MKEFTYTEEGRHAVIQLPSCQQQDEWFSLRDRIHHQFIGRGQVHLVLDCEQAIDLPSIAIGSFTSLARDLRRVQGSLHLIHVSEKTRRILARIKLDELIPVRGTLTEVIRKSGEAAVEG